MAIDITAFCDVQTFKNRVNHLIDELKQSPLSEGSKGIFVPGEIEFLQEQVCRRDGIPLSLDVLRELDDFASEIGISSLGA